jgi:hypothetical protein
MFSVIFEARPELDQWDTREAPQCFPEVSRSAR